MEEFLTAIENHPISCGFMMLMAILLCTIRIHWHINNSDKDE